MASPGRSPVGDARRTVRAMESNSAPNQTPTQALCAFGVTSVVKTTLGERIALARKRAGLSQEELATAVGAGEEGDARSTVSRWENDHAIPKGETLIKLPEVLNVSADWLLLDRPVGWGVVSLPHDALIELRDWMRRVLPPEE